MTEETKNEIKDAIGEVLDEKLGPLYIEREQHYQDHCFVKGVREGLNTARKASIWTLVVTLVSALIYAAKVFFSGGK